MMKGMRVRMMMSGAELRNNGWYWLRSFSKAFWGLSRRAHKKLLISLDSIALLLVLLEVLL